MPHPTNFGSRVSIVYHSLMECLATKVFNKKTVSTFALNNNGSLKFSFIDVFYILFLHCDQVQPKKFSKKYTHSQKLLKHKFSFQRKHVLSKQVFTLHV